MAILVRLDEKLHEPGMTLTELAARVDIYVANHEPAGVGWNWGLQCCARRRPQLQTAAVARDSSIESQASCTAARDSSQLNADAPRANGQFNAELPRRASHSLRR